ncbi:LysE family translocator [Vibrio profundum]|uniref:LysE family translocator n=1 Tax=Vibrio profundum TaxID=2910247 RepID=UPI003D0EA1D7
MTLTAWLSLFAICLVGAMSPGPSLAMVVKHSLAGGRKNGFATAWAHSGGIGVYAFLTLFGLAVVLHHSLWLFNSLSIIGALYLAYLGINAIRSKGGVAEKLQSGEPVSLWQSAKEGLLISLLNPKIAIFFIALFSQFVSEGHGWGSRLLIVLTPIIVDGLWYSIITLMVSHPSFITKIRSKARLIDRVSGVILVLLALRVVFTI